MGRNSYGLEDSFSSVAEIALRHQVPTVHHSLQQDRNGLALRHHYIVHQRLGYEYLLPNFHTFCLPNNFVNFKTENTCTTVPVPPESPSEAITYNSSTVSVWFDLWGSGGCDILYYTIEWKQSKSDEWILRDSKHIAATERMYTVGDLEPATRHQLKVTAHNNIGSSYALYNFTTLTIDGGNFNKKKLDHLDRLDTLYVFIFLP